VRSQQALNARLGKLLPLLMQSQFHSAISTRQFALQPAYFWLFSPVKTQSGCRRAEQTEHKLIIFSRIWRQRIRLNKRNLVP
jgi:hypothetical protein